MPFAEGHLIPDQLVASRRMMIVASAACSSFVAVDVSIMQVQVTIAKLRIGQCSRFGECLGVVTSETEILVFRIICIEIRRIRAAQQPVIIARVRLMAHSTHTDTKWHVLVHFTIVKGSLRGWKTVTIGVPDSPTMAIEAQLGHGSLDQFCML